MTDFERFIKENNLKKKDIASFLGVSNAFITQLCSGERSISDGKLAQIKANSHDWDTSMFEHPMIYASATNNGSAKVTIGPYNNQASAKKKNKAKTEKVQSSNSIPLIPMGVDSISSYLNHRSPMCEQIISPIPVATCAIRVSGDSMFPEYKNGDICFLKKINPSVFVEWGKVYVLDTENGVVLRKVCKSETEGSVSCSSLNTDKTYDFFELRMEHIHDWYKVLAVMTIKL